MSVELRMQGAGNAETASRTPLPAVSIPWAAKGQRRTAEPEAKAKEKESVSMNQRQTIGAPAGRAGALRSRSTCPPRAAAFGEREPARRGRGACAVRIMRRAGAPAAQPLPGPAGERPARPHRRGERLGTANRCSWATAATSCCSTWRWRGAARAHLPRPAAHLLRVRRERAPHEHARWWTCRACADFSIDEDAVLARVAEGDIDYLVVTQSRTTPRGSWPTRRSSTRCWKPPTRS